MDLREEFERLRSMQRRTPEQERRFQRRDEIRTGVKLIALAVALPFLYPVSGMINMMSGTSPLGWTITIVAALASLWAGIRALTRKH